MKKIISAVLILSALTAAGQKLKKVTNTISHSRFNKIKEEYYVLNDDRQVRHGLYKRWWNNKLEEEGYYKLNQKDSTWICYGANLNVLGTGNYAKDEKTGVWKHYSNVGELEREYDFSNKKIITFKVDPIKTSAQVINGRDTTFAVLSCPPTATGGASALFNVIIRNLRYPESAVRNNIGGKVLVSFMIDETGKTSDYKVVEKGDTSLDNEAIRVVKLVDDWLPAIKDGKPVKVIHTVPINFNL